MSSQLIKLPEKYQKLEEVLQEPLTMMLWAPRQDLSAVQKGKSKKESKLSTLLLSTK